MGGRITSHVKSGLDKETLVRISRVKKRTPGHHARCLGLRAFTWTSRRETTIIYSIVAKFLTIADHAAVDAGVVKATLTGTDEQDATIGKSGCFSANGVE